MVSELTRGTQWSLNTPFILSGSRWSLQRSLEKVPDKQHQPCDHGKAQAACQDELYVFGHGRVARRSLHRRRGRVLALFIAFELAATHGQNGSAS